MSANTNNVKESLALKTHTDDAVSSTAVSEVNAVSGETKAGVNPENAHSTETAGHSAAAGHEGAAAAEGAHGGGKGGHGGGGHEQPEIPNIITLVKQYPAIKDNPKLNHMITFLETPFFTLIAVITVSIIVIKGTKRLQMIPGKLQNVIEFFIEGFANLVEGILGKKNGRRFLPYVGSLFVFIFFNNLMGIIPFMKSATSVIYTTAALAILTFLYVQYVGFTSNGFFGYIHHLMGSPRDALGWILSPFMFVLHVISEFAKPVSLSLRLFGNILGEDILLGAFLIMGIGMMHAFTGTKIPVGVPLQFPFLFLALMTSAIQALVFSMLSTIYFMMVLPHDEEHEEEHH